MKMDNHIILRRLISFVLVMLFTLVLAACSNEKGSGDAQSQSATTPTRPVPTLSTLPPSVQSDVIFVQNDIFITQIGKYTGMFMEDGTDEIVSDTMMIILRNNYTQDLQLARIYVEYADFTAEFEVTNLAQGESVVLLEKNRHKAVEEKHISITMENVVFFPEAMSLHPKQLKITGTDGNIIIENISDQDITGTIYVYYKNCSGDYLYGGITYRTTLEGGLKQGKTAYLPTSHYFADNSTVVQVVIG